MLGTSRPSLREALQALKARGWVDIRHGSGVFVADPATSAHLSTALGLTLIDIARSLRGIETALTLRCVPTDGARR